MSITNRIRGIPSPTIIKDNATRQVCVALYEALEQLRGNVGLYKDKAITVRDLSDIGVVGILDGAGGNSSLYKPQERLAPRNQIREISGVNGTIEVVDTETKATISLNIEDGQITNFAGRFDCLDPASRATITITVDGGSIVPSASFLAHDPITDTTRLITVFHGRIVEL